MSQFLGIYGFNITKPIRVGGLQIQPVHSSYREAKDRAKDPHRFVLTAVAESSGPEDISFELAGALTFCDQRWVIVTRAPQPAPDTTLDIVKNQLRPELDFHVRRGEGGPLIQEDAFAPDSRAQFLELCLARLRDDAFDQHTGFRQAFFRAVESRRMVNPFIDVTYYLDFSAIEIVARTTTGDTQPGNVAPIIASYLKRLGFDVEQDDPTRPFQSIQNYARLRNALFHQGRFEATLPQNGGTDIQLTDYDQYWHRLVPDVLLRILGFDDGQINWNRWLDRMPFQ